MKLNVSGILKREPAAMAGLMSAVRKSARIGCSKVGAESIEDDVAQEVAMLFIDRLVDRFDESYNAEPLLIETCRRVALSLLRKNRELCVEDPNELIDGENDVINARNDFDSNPVSYLDQQKALQALTMEKVSEILLEDSPPPKIDGASVIKRRGRAERVLSKSCARLREIRVSLGMSQESFSSQLGIPTATLLSYEYGRTPNVPEHIMEKAEEVFKREHTVAKRNQAQAERPMREIINEWAEMLRIDPNDFKTISEIVGVAKSTIHRWVDGEMRPRPRELNAYIRSVKVVAKRIQSGSKVIKEIY
jgi:DNA-binding transcriptional regulator YiaG